MQTSYSELRANLAHFLDETISSRDPIIVRSRGREDVALIAASELNGLIETAHLLHSSRNAARLSSALENALNGEGKLQTPEELATELGLKPSSERR